MLLATPATASTPFLGIFGEKVYLGLRILLIVLFCGGLLANSLHLIYCYLCYRTVGFPWRRSIFLINRSIADIATCFISLVLILVDSLYTDDHQLYQAALEEALDTYPANPFLQYLPASITYLGLQKASGRRLCQLHGIPSGTGIPLPFRCTVCDWHGRGADYIRASGCPHVHQRSPPSLVQNETEDEKLLLDNYSPCGAQVGVNFHISHSTKICKARKMHSSMSRDFFEGHSEKISIFSFSSYKTIDCCKVSWILVC